MARRLVLCLACVLILAAPATGGDIYHKKREVDDRISSLHSKIANAKSQEAVLTQEITVVNGKISGLQDDVARAQRQLATLESQLAASQQKLNRLTQLFGLQTRKLELLRREYGIALQRLERRIVDAYETPNVDAVDVVLAATSMNAMLTNIEYVQQVGKQDKRISDQLHTAKVAMHDAREQTRKTKREVAVQTAAIRERTDQQHAVTEQLMSTEQQLATARASKSSTLSSIKVNEREFVQEANALQSVSADLAAKIQAAESRPAPTSTPAPSSGGSSVSSSGFIWPVNGPIASPFGSRCLPNGDCSSHPGIDIAVPAGTPIRAAAAGTVIFTGWEGGYGNLTIIDHGNSLATAYGHQSSIAVSAGTYVAQGQVIGYVGCTGYCFGAHLHFEVRVNGQPVDPLSYL